MPIVTLGGSRTAEFQMFFLNVFICFTSTVLDKRHIAEILDSAPSFYHTVKLNIQSFHHLYTIKTNNSLIYLTGIQEQLKYRTLIISPSNGMFKMLAEIAPGAKLCTYWLETPPKYT